MLLPLRNETSAVITIFAPEPTIRWFSADAPYPANTRVCTAPIRAQASIAITCSGTVGM